MCGQMHDTTACPVPVETGRIVFGDAPSLAQNAHQELIDRLDTIINLLDTIVRRPL
jgi:hypothetical protein